jgi:CheY-like chemotaxis protein
MVIASALSDMNGLVLLDRLKRDGQTRNIPILLSTSGGDEVFGRARGAMAVLHKPADRAAVEACLTGVSGLLEKRPGRVLIGTDDPTAAERLIDLCRTDRVEAIRLDKGAEVLASLEAEPCQLVIATDRLADMSGLALMEKLSESPALSRIPAVLHAEQPLDEPSAALMARLRRRAVVRAVHHLDHLLEQVAVFLHLPDEELPPARREALRKMLHRDLSLGGRRVLVVDDDVRNIFAITAVLEEHEMKVDYAENGHQALAKLREGPDVDLVLMDIMMPGMDGYEAMRRIRETPRHVDLPIIALTAKAMKGDREKCLSAGASDYVMKPVDTDQLTSLMRVWLDR